MRHDLTMKKNLIRWLGFLALPVLCTGCQLIPEEETFQNAPVLYSYEMKEYSQETVVRGDLVLSMTVNSTYMAAKQEQLSFALGGEYIDKIYVSEGQQVQKGQLQEGSDSVEERYEKQLQEVADAIYLAELQLEELKKNLQQRQIYAGMDGTVIQVKKCEIPKCSY